MPGDRKSLSERLVRANSAKVAVLLFPKRGQLSQHKKAAFHGQCRAFPGFSHLATGRFSQACKLHRVMQNDVAATWPIGWQEVATISPPVRYVPPPASPCPGPREPARANAVGRSPGPNVPGYGRPTAAIRR